MKKCQKCGETKELSLFAKNKARKDGLQTQCRTCMNDASRRKYAEHPEICRSYTKRFHEKNPDFSWASTMRRRYGITVHQFFELLAKQDYSCAVCLSKQPGGHGRFHVDHDHGNGKIRGLLCHGCNTILGHAKDNTETLRQAAAYLEKHAQEVTDRLAELQLWVAAQQQAQ